MPRIENQGTIWLVACLVAAGCNGPQLPDGPPHIHVLQREKDLGEIPVSAEGQDVEFRLENRGLSDLKVTQLNVSCACIQARATKVVVAPGKTGAIVVRVRSQGPEARSASVGILTNDPDQPEAVLRLTWRAVAELEFEPSELDFGRVRPDATVTRLVRLVRRKNIGNTANVLATAKTSPAERLEARLDGEFVEITLRAGPECGMESGGITFPVTGSESTRLRLPVRWTVVDTIEATPRRLYLGSGGPGMAVRGRIVVASTAGI